MARFSAKCTSLARNSRPRGPWVRLWPSTALPVVHVAVARRRPRYARYPWNVRAESEPPGRRPCLRQAPINIGRVPSRTTNNLCGHGTGWPFSGLGASWSTDLNLAVPGHNMGPLNNVTRAQLRGCRVSINPWSLRPTRAPRTRGSGSQSQVQLPFIPKESRWADILLTSPDDEKQRCSGNAATAPRPTR